MLSEPPITPDLLLRAYAAGIFPMASDRESADLEWYRPEVRGVLPLDERFHVPKKLLRLVRSGAFSVTSDTAFKDVMAACAEAAPGRETTWISHRIGTLYQALFEAGRAHSIEVWQEEKLVGGLYGVHLGGAFFGESMFSRQTDASKVALVHLVAHLRRQGFQLLDTQYPTAHLERFGCLEIPAAQYLVLLQQAIALDVSWNDAVGRDDLAHEIAAFRRGA